MAKGKTATDEAVAAHFAKTEQFIKTGKNCKTNMSRKTVMDNLAKARAVQALKKKERQIVEEKVAAGLPITEEERALLTFRTNKKQADERKILAQAAKLMIKPQSVHDLRLLVETTAAKHHYNPIESLILQTQDPNIPEKDKVAIHKVLLPFLVPQLPAPKAATPETEDTGIKVTVTQFVFPPNEKNVTPLHKQKPTTVKIEQDAPTDPV